MKICYIVNDLNKRAGTEKAVTLIANKMAELGHDITILSFINIVSPGYKLNENIKILDLDIQGSLKVKYISVIKKIRKIVKKYNFDFVVEAEVYNRLFTTTALAYLDVKVVTWEHFNYFVTLGRKERAFARVLASKYSDAIVTLTERDRNNYLDNLKCKAIIKSIPNAVEFTPQFTCNYENKNILAVGRLTYQKGFDILLRCWNDVVKCGKASGWILNIVGNGEDKEKLENYIIENGIEKNVIIHEPTSKIEEFYKGSSIYVMTSRFEGLPMVLIEAMSFGMPVVSLDCQTGPAELIVDGENGYLCEVDDFETFCTRLISLIECIEMREVMGKEAKKVIDRLDIDIILNKWIELFKELGV